MPGTIAQFMHDIKKETDIKVVHPLNVAVRETAMVGYDQATTLYRDGGRTPINTGLYRANWRITLTAPSTYSANESFAQRPKTSIWAADQFSSTYAQSRSSSERLANNFSVNSHDGIYLTNNTSYASYIENGGEHIGPHGVLRRAFDKMNTALDAKLQAIP